MLFNAFSPLAGVTPESMYKDKEYPLDLNGALDFTRPATGAAYYGQRPTIGYIEGLMPLMDVPVLQISAAPGVPSGLWSSSIATESVPQNFDFIFPNYAALAKGGE